jgi:hypothetical protein
MNGPSLEPDFRTEDDVYPFDYLDEAMEVIADWDTDELEDYSNGTE